MPAMAPHPGGPLDGADRGNGVEAAAARWAVGGGAAAREEVRAILEARARELARPPAVAPVEEALEIVTFSVAEETYAVETRFVLAVFRLASVAVVPGAQGAIACVTAWRGDLLPLLDLPRLLGRGASPGEPGRVVVIGDERPAFGILASAVGEIVRTPRSQVMPADHCDEAVRGHVLGITGQAVLVLDAERLVHSYR